MTQVPDPRPGAYYVTVFDGRRYGRVAGPFEWHIQALLMVDQAREKACEVEPRAVFYSFGTGRWPVGETRPGVLNAALQI